MKHLFLIKMIMMKGSKKLEKGFSFYLTIILFAELSCMYYLYYFTHGLILFYLQWLKFFEL